MVDREGRRVRAAERGAGFRSTERAARRAESSAFARQREAFNRYARANGIQIVQEFTGEAVGGTTEAMNRAGLTDLFVALKANGVRMVVVENATRLARDLMISEIILGEFRKIGVKVVRADGGIDLSLGNDDPSGKLRRQIVGQRHATREPIDES